MGLSTFDVFKNLNPDTDDFILLEGETLKRYQRTLLGMAEDIINVCDDKGIYYQLSGGTAIGAVRHGGFIPWDDDIDLNILSCDMKRLADALHERYGDKYVFQDCYDQEYGNVTGKIRLRGSISRGREDIGLKECGFAVDLFPIENLFNNRILYYLHGFLCMCFGFLLSCRKFYARKDFFRGIEAIAPEFRSTFEKKIFIGRLTAFLSVRRWAILTNGCYSLCKNKKSLRVGIPSGRGHYFKETYPRDGMIPVKKYPFENHLWSAACDPDAYLGRLYGPDYMTPPPEDKREKHFLLELVFPEEM